MRIFIQLKKKEKKLLFKCLEVISSFFFDKFNKAGWKDNNKKFSKQKKIKNYHYLSLLFM